MLLKVLLRFSILVVVSCASLKTEGHLTAPVAPILDLKETVILLSLDGFRWDYFEHSAIPHLASIAKEGVRVRKLKPVFPSLTFPNHYSIVTGTYAQNHGIISNQIRDPDIAQDFMLGRFESIKDPRWWQAEPIWITSERQQVKAATMFWVGSDIEIAGMRPSYWHKYDGTLSYSKRVDQVLSWLDLSVEKRPQFLSLYFESPDQEGHEHGAHTLGMQEGLKKVDTEIGRLVEGLRLRGIYDKVHLIVLSDHGMITIDPSRIIEMDKILDSSKLSVLGQGSTVSVFPKDNNLEEIYQSIKSKARHFKVFKKNNIPQRFYLKKHKRVPPLLLLADEGYYFLPAGRNPPKGAHGYDNALDSMQSFLVAKGPLFREAYLKERLEVVDVYNLLCKILKIKASKNDGNWQRAKSLLKDGG